MSRYHRNREGYTYFFTVVTHHRRPILTTDIGRLALRNAIREVRRIRPFDLIAIVLLPDHLHTIWTLPHDDSDYSTRWRHIKSLFTSAWLAQEGTDIAVTRSRMSRGERGIWQRRFYEHTCRDETDLKRCLDYLHVNPLRHGLVHRVQDWPWSSFHRFVQLREYPINWGNASIWDGDEFSNFE